jgi:hypothetical protein
MHGSDLEPHEKHGALTERRVAGFQWNCCRAVDVVHRPEVERPHVCGGAERAATCPTAAPALAVDQHRLIGG